MHTCSYFNMNDISDRILEVCVLEYNALDLFVHRVCESHCGVCFMFVWEYIYISLARFTNAPCVHDEYSCLVPHVHHRHVFGLFNMKCMPATLNAYSLHLHIYDGCGVCARLTWLFLEVSTHTH
jgi:hypothetical protein